MTTATKTNDCRVFMVGHYGCQISEQSEPTMMTRREAQEACDRRNRDERTIENGESPFFVTRNRKYAAE